MLYKITPSKAIKSHTTINITISLLALGIPVICHNNLSGSIFSVKLNKYSIGLLNQSKGEYSPEQIYAKKPIIGDNGNKIHPNSVNKVNHTPFNNPYKNLNG